MRDVTFPGSAGDTIPAYIVTPNKGGPFPAVLYVHWLGEVRSDRTEFLEEALSLARKGVKSLLVQAPWADPGWFAKRKLGDDFEFSVRQVKDLGRALDVLLAQPDVDARRVAYVGHDFGAMYGAGMLSFDRRVRFAVLMAATPVFSDWFLLGTKLPAEEQSRYVEHMAAFDASRFLPASAVSEFLFQFSTRDKYVPRAAAEAFAAAATGAKEVLWYDAPHSLDAKAQRDRMAWLLKRLERKPA